MAVSSKAKGVLVIGLTGSFGTGKTTVARIFKNLGAEVIDADRLAHAALKKGSSAYKKVEKVFGAAVLDSRRNIDKRRLAEIVFRKRALLGKLCEIVHPFVIDRIKNAIRSRAKGRVFVVDAPLLVEAGLRTLVDKLIVVSATQKNQIERCTAKFKMTKADVLRRIKSQMPLKEKMGMADFVIYNNGTIENTERQVINVWRESLWR